MVSVWTIKVITLYGMNPVIECGYSVKYSICNTSLCGWPWLIGVFVVLERYIYSKNRTV